MIRLPKSFLLCGLIVDVDRLAVSQADVRAAAVETFAGRLEIPWAIDFASFRVSGKLERHFTASSAACAISSRDRTKRSICSSAIVTAAAAQERRMTGCYG